MDNQSHFKWELTSDELDTIWWALIDRKDRLYSEAERCTDPKMRLLKEKLASKCGNLQGQINRMRARCY